MTRTRDNLPPGATLRDIEENANPAPEGPPLRLPDSGAPGHEGAPPSPMSVFVIVDDKYGTQAIFASLELAEKALADNPRRYHISGAGACVLEWEVKEN